jgi:hypothetical protein
MKLCWCPACWEVHEMDTLPEGLLYCHTCGRAWEPGELQEAAYLEGYEDAQAEAQRGPGRPAAQRAGR